MIACVLELALVCLFSLDCSFEVRFCLSVCFLSKIETIWPVCLPRQVITYFHENRMLALASAHSLISDATVGIQIDHFYYVYKSFSTGRSLASWVIIPQVFVFLKALAVDRTQERTTI